MEIIKYDGSQAEFIRIITEKSARGLILVYKADTAEEKFLGFSENPIQQRTPMEEQLQLLQDTIDVLLLKQEGII